jgi:hypothetical protein
MSYKSLKDIYAEKCIGIPVGILPRRAIFFPQLLEEGGAAGHMDHPFDLPQVKTGRDLVNVFNKSIQSIQKTPPSVKIDGVNASIKLVTNADGSLEFGLDRGSNKPLDVKGVTKSDLTGRFGEGHGMIDVGGEVLDIFNKALPTIKDDLSKLGFFKRPLLFNMEYVKGGTNVIGYADNFLAIHSINEIYEVKSPVKGSVSRSTREIAYNVEVLQDLIEKVNKIAGKYGFKVLGSVPAEVKENIDLSSTLNTEMTVKFSDHTAETKTLKAWLDQSKNPRGKKITLSNGKKIDALSKQVYSDILNGVSLDQYIKDGNKEQEKDAISGAVFYHATRLLGQKIIDSMTSEMGDINSHEGVVIRDSSISAKPFKLTGNFIVRGLESRFAQQENEETTSGGAAVKSLLKNVAAVNNVNNYQTNPSFGYQSGANRVGEGGLGSEV